MNLPSFLFEIIWNNQHSLKFCINVGMSSAQIVIEMIKSRCLVIPMSILPLELFLLIIVFPVNGSHFLIFLIEE